MTWIQFKSTRLVQGNPRCQLVPNGIKRRQRSFCGADGVGAGAVPVATLVREQGKRGKSKPSTGT